MVGRLGGIISSVHALQRTLQPVCSGELNGINNPDDAATLTEAGNADPEDEPTPPAARAANVATRVGSNSQPVMARRQVEPPGSMAPTSSPGE